MAQYTTRRLVAMLPTLIGLSMILFLLVRLMPGDAALLQAFSGDDLVLEDDADPEAIEEMRRQLGIDKPLPVQYVIWVADTVTLDFGTSYWTRKPVISEMRRRLPITIQLLVMSVAVAVITGLVVGVVSAVYQDTPVDYLGRLVGVLGLSLPNFWIALLVILLPALWWRYLAPPGYTPFLDDPLENLEKFALPSLTLGWSLSASIMRMSRSEVLEVLRQDYVRTARAKGLGERSVIYRHVLRNSLIPVVTVIGLQIGGLIGGSVVIENVFGLPGVGQLILTAINQRDYPVIQTAVLLAALGFLFTNLIVDLSYGLLDPRIRYN